MRTNLQKIAKLITDRAPEILTGVAVVGVATTAVMGGKAAVRASRIIEKENEIKRGWVDNDLSRKEEFHLVWRLFVPTVVMGTLTVTAILAAQSVNTKNKIALAGLYTLSEGKLKEYEEKIVETLGEEKAKEIKEEIQQKKVNTFDSAVDNVIHTKGGEHLCYDEMSGRYFRSSREAILDVVNTVNHFMMQDWTADLNEVYTALGLPTIPMGKLIGWNADELIDPRITSKVAKGGEPCLVLDFYNEPVIDFDRL